MATILGPICWYMRPGGRLEDARDRANSLRSWMRKKTQVFDVLEIRRMAEQVCREFTAAIVDTYAYADADNADNADANY